MFPEEVSQAISRTRLHHREISMEDIFIFNETIREEIKCHLENFDIECVVSEHGILITRRTESLVSDRDCKSYEGETRQRSQ